MTNPSEFLLGVGIGFFCFAVIAWLLEAATGGRPCARCNGNGYVTGKPEIDAYFTCDSCSGTGRHGNKKA